MRGDWGHLIEIPHFCRHHLHPLRRPIAEFSCVCGDLQLSKCSAISGAMTGRGLAHGGFSRLLRQTETAETFTVARVNTRQRSCRYNSPHALRRSCVGRNYVPNKYARQKPNSTHFCVCASGQNLPDTTEMRVGAELRWALSYTTLNQPTAPPRHIVNVSRFDLHPLPRRVAGGGRSVRPVVRHVVQRTAGADDAIAIFGAVAEVGADRIGFAERLACQIWIDHETLASLANTIGIVGRACICMGTGRNTGTIPRSKEEVRAQSRELLAYALNERTNTKLLPCRSSGWQHLAWRWISEKL